MVAWTAQVLETSVSLDVLCPSALRPEFPSWSLQPLPNYLPAKVADRHGAAKARPSLRMMLRLFVLLVFCMNLSEDVRQSQKKIR